MKIGDKVVLPFDNLIGTLISNEFTIDNKNTFIVEVPSTVFHGSFYTMTIYTEKMKKVE